MATLSQLQRLLSPRFDRIPSAVQHVALRSVSTAASKAASPSPSPSTANPRAGCNSRKGIISKAPLITRVPPPRSQLSRQSSPEPPSPPLDAIRAAEAREAALRAARLRRSSQRREEALEYQKKEVEKKDYQKRYNTTARKWVSSMIALPIFFVTSYYLFDRLALGNEQKVLPKVNE